MGKVETVGLAVVTSTTTAVSSGFSSRTTDSPVTTRGAAFPSRAEEPLFRSVENTERNENLVKEKREKSFLPSEKLSPKRFLRRVRAINPVLPPAVYIFFVSLPFFVAPEPVSFSILTSLVVLWPTGNGCTFVWTETSDSRSATERRMDTATIELRGSDQLFLTEGDEQGQ